jgi:hypothetical protein
VQELTYVRNVLEIWQEIRINCISSLSQIYCVWEDQEFLGRKGRTEKFSKDF